MIPVSRILNRARNIVGDCSDDVLFQYLTDAVEMLANKGDFDPLLGMVDITADADQRTVTLPSVVETVLAASVAGRPTFGYDRLFEFHLNGPGRDPSFHPTDFRWIRDGFQHPTFKDLAAPSRLAASVEKTEDVDCEIWVEGEDASGNIIRTETGPATGIFRNGYLVPTTTVGGTPTVDPAAPVFSKITAVHAEPRNGYLNLFADDGSGAVLISTYQWNETDPLFRRITLDEAGQTARLLFRRRVFEIRSANDLIPLHSSLAVLEALRAVVDMADDMVSSLQHEANAARLLSEKEQSLQAPFASPIQVDPRNALHDRNDSID